MYYFESKFYILANRCDKRQGFYLIEFDEKQPKKNKPEYLIKQKFSSDIGDASLKIIENKNEPGKKYLVACQKTMKSNIFHIQVVEIKTKSLRFHMEISNLWESNIAGLMLSTNDFIIFSEEGISILCIFEINQKRIVEDRDNKKWIIHPL